MSCHNEGKKGETETYIHYLLIIHRHLNDAFIRRWRKSNKFWNIKVPKTNSAQPSHKSQQQLIIYRPAYHFFSLPSWCKMWADCRLKVGRVDRYRNAVRWAGVTFIIRDFPPFLNGYLLYVNILHLSKCAWIYFKFASD